VRLGVVATVLAAHAATAWVVMQVHHDPLVASDMNPIEVSFIEAEKAPEGQPLPEQALQPQVAQEPPRPEQTQEAAEPEQRQEQVREQVQDPSPQPSQLQSMVVPESDLPMPPPTPLAEAALPQLRPKAPPPRPLQLVPAKPAPPLPSTAQHEQVAAPAVPPPRYTGPKTVTVSQITYIDPPKPFYPLRARAAREWGTAVVRVLIDEAGNPSEVKLDMSSTHAMLDEEALRCVRAARFKPYLEGAQPQRVWVVIPVHFILQQR
jgi:protein TonB